MTWFLAALVGYLLGATPFAFIAGRSAAGVDLRHTGSGNVGATNLLRSSQWSVALPVVALDVAKGTLAAWFGGWVTGSPIGADLGAVMATLGHVFPVWLRFQGGKGVATAAGAFAVAAPYAALGCTIAFLGVVWHTRFVSLGSITAAILLPVLAVFTDTDTSTVTAAAATAALILIRHRDNLLR